MLGRDRGAAAQRRLLRVAAARRRTTAPGRWRCGLGRLLHAARHGRDAPLDAPALRAGAGARGGADARAAGAARLREPHRAAVIVVRARARRARRPVRARRRLGGDVRARAAAHGGHRAPPRGADRARGRAADRACRTEHAPPLGGALASLIKNSSDVVCVLGADGSCSYVSPSVAGDPRPRPRRRWPSAELIELVHPDDAPRLRALRRRDRGQPAGQPVAGRVPRRAAPASEGWRDVEALACNLLADEAVEGIVLNMRDISERKAFEDELEHQAFHDTLTGLPEPRAVPQPRRARARRPPPRPARRSR